MNYLKIEHEDVCNGIGIRCTIWFTGCSHECAKCFNKETWDHNSGIPFDNEAKQEIFNELSKDYISGITLTGGDPLYKYNLTDVLSLLNQIRLSYPTKTIWLYTGYTLEQILQPLLINTIPTKEEEKRIDIVKMVDVLVDGPYVDAQRDVAAKWRGSTNQRVINIPETLKQQKVVLYCD